MDHSDGTRSKAKTITLTALLGLFVVAALVALAGKFLPGPLSRLIGRGRGQHSND
jgi:hypothetical protein